MSDIIVRGECNGLKICYFLDTGAALSLVSSRLIHQLDLMDHIRPTKRLVAGLNKEIIKMHGEIELHVHLAGENIRHTFVVCNDDIIQQEILLGVDVMQKVGMQIDIPKKIIYTPKGSTEFISKPVKLSGRYTIKCNKTVIVKANSVGYLVGKLGIPSTKLNYEGVVTGCDRLIESLGVCVQGALAYTDRNLVPIQCVNTMPHDVTIYRNSMVGFMDPLAQQDRVKGIHRLTGNSAFYDAELDYPRLPDAIPEHVTVENGRWENTNDLLEQLKVDDVEISPRHKEQLKNLLVEYSHVFARDKFDLGKASFFTAQLELKPGYICKWVPSRPIAYQMQHHMDKEIRNLADSGQIEPAGYSKFNSCIFLVGKPDGKNYRLVQDMRQLNTQTLPDNFPLPRIDTIMNKMTDNNYLSVFDFLKGFTQIGLEEESRPCTSFTYKDRRYQWSTLPQGHMNSSSQFARAMAILFANVPFQALISYLDDILVGSKSVEEHLKRLKFIFQRLSWGNLKVSPSKCQLFKREVKFLGHRISNEGLRIDEDRIKAVQELPEPKNRKQLQQFMGTMNYMRSYIRNMSAISEPLYALLKKGVPYDFNTECQESFKKLKTALTRAPVLSLPDLENSLQSYEVTIDSSKKGHAAVLTQIVDGRRRVISYFSKGVPFHHKKLGASRLEFLGLYHALKHWRLFLQGGQFRVITDCYALLNLETLFKNENSYYQRRLAELSGFRFTISHVSGKSGDIRLADMLSRYPFEKSFESVGCQTDGTPGSGDMVKVGFQPNNEVNRVESETVSQIRRALEIEDAKINDPVTLDEIKEDYKDDRDLSTVISWLTAGNIPDKVSYRKNTARLCHYWKNINLLKFDDGVLYRKWIEPNDRSKDRELIVVPGSLVERILYTYHNNSCHSGLQTALELCRRKFFFYKMKRDFKMFCQACITCARNKQSQAVLRAPLRPIVYTRFNQCISVDFNEPSKLRNKNGYVALLTIVDMYSNYVVVKPTKTTTSSEAIKIILREWVYKYGAPSNILHDRGSHFTSALFSAMLNAFDVRDTMGTPWHSETQGRVEAFNKRVNVALRVSLNDKQWQEYDRFIDVITFTLNCLRSTKTGFSAHMLAFGRECAMPQDLFVPQDERLDQLEAEIISDVDRKKFLVYNSYREMCEVNRKVVANAATKAMYMKKNFDKYKMKGPYPNKDDWCLVKVDVPAHKFADRFRGPYKIVQKLSHWNYILDFAGVHRLVNISKLKLYKPNRFTKLSENLLQNSKVAGKPVGGGEEQRRRPIWDSSSDSEDNSFTIVTRSKAKKRQLRERQRGQLTSVPGSGEADGSEQVSGNQSHSSSNDEDEPDVQVTTESRGESVEICQHDSESDMNNSFVSANEGMTGDEVSDNGGIALADGSVNRDHPVSADSDSHGNQGGAVLNAPAIDDTSLLLSDIERHESSRGRVRPRGGTGSRATAAPDETGPGSSTGNQEVEDTPRSRTREERTGYGLRREPKKTQFFGNPISSLVKKRRK